MLKVNAPSDYLHKFSHGLISSIPTQQYEGLLAHHHTDRLLMRVKPEVLCRFIIDESPSAQVFYSAKTSAIITANKALAKLLGYSIEELQEKKITELIHPDDRRFEKEFLCESYYSKTTFTNSVKRFWSKTGETIWGIFSSKCATNEFGDILFTMATIQDITEYKQSENQAIDMIAYFEQRIQEYSIEVKNLRSQYKDVEDYKQRFSDVASHEFRTALTIIQSSCEILQRYYGETAHEDVKKRFSIIFDSIYGVVQLLDDVLEIEPVKDNHYKPSQQTLKNTSIAEQKEEQEQFRTLPIRSSSNILNNDDVLQSIDENLKVIMHDLQNPLASIMVIATSIERNWNKMMLPDIKNSLQSIGQKAQMMKDMMSRFLDVSSLETMYSSMTLRNTNLVPLIQKVVEEYQAHAEAKRIGIHFSTELPEAFVAVDKNFMLQVADNLLSNAIKYSHKGSNIEVRLKLRNQRGIEKISVEVQDNGQGIKKEEMKRLFTRFGRLSAKPTGGEQSTGLGLWIVKRIVEAMNGTIRCKSVWGQGSVFIIDFPSNASKV